MELNRRCFVKAAGVAGLGAGSVWAGFQTSLNTQNKTIKSSKAAISVIRVAQVKVYPQKGQMKANHIKLMDILKDIEKNEDVDVVVTPEGFLDGYVSTEKSVAKKNMINYAIDPLSSEFTHAVSEWAGWEHPLNRFDKALGQNDDLQEGPPRHSERDNPRSTDQAHSLSQGIPGRDQSFHQHPQTNDRASSDVDRILPHGRYESTSNHPHERSPRGATNQGLSADAESR